MNQLYEKVFVVGGAVGGAVEGEQYGTETVETFRGGDDTWRSHEPLPFGPLLGAAAVSIGSDPVPTLVGGSKRQKGLIQVKQKLRFAFFISEKMEELNLPPQLFDGEWELSEVELKNEVFYPVAVTSRPQWVCFP